MARRYAPPHFQLATPDREKVYTRSLREMCQLILTTSHDLPQIGLNLLHFQEELFIFGDLNEISDLESTPNVVRIYPTHRKDVETHLAIHIGAIQAAMGTANQVCSTEGKTDCSENEHPISAPPSEKVPQEIDFLRMELSNLFATKYSVFRVRIYGTKPESRAVGLTNFYAKHKIANGKLRGTWNLFEKADLKEIMDSGVVERAKNVELKNVSISIPGYDTIIRTKDIPVCRQAMERIVSDYMDYLNGNSGGYIGSVPISIPFSPIIAIEKSFRDLKMYLYDLKPANENSYQYKYEVDQFLNDEQKKSCRFLEKVKLKMDEAAYKESQWDSKDFVSALLNEAAKKPNFFDSDFLRLLKRYANLLFKS